METCSLLSPPTLEEKFRSGYLLILSFKISLLQYYAKYITSVISKICAPVRDKTVAQLSKETDIVAIFRGIVEVCVYFLLKMPIFYMCQDH